MEIFQVCIFRVSDRGRFKPKDGAVFFGVSRNLVRSNLLWYHPCGIIFGTSLSESLSTNRRPLRLPHLALLIILHLSCNNDALSPIVKTEKIRKGLSKRRVNKWFSCYEKPSSTILFSK